MHKRKPQQILKTDHVNGQTLLPREYRKTSRNNTPAVVQGSQKANQCNVSVFSAITRDVCAENGNKRLKAPPSISPLMAS